ncbi:agamous-like MADS-box protein AGL61 [Prosopis cineraria]|uniref:agamous-like MADS-box protein AGL61 n=1 Tax=Prosopis cineraria TaxID=364024 RepID=UPI00240F57FB|nr:agamous-like MADS-box protein AGL61 [Prosopis cineraria]
MASSSSPKTTRKPGKGRRKIEIKKVEQTSKRFVTFSKRKLGLFRKAAELSLLCDSQIAVVVFSQFGKVYTSGYPDPDAVIRRYLSGTSSLSSDPTSVQGPERESAMSPLRREYEEAMKVFEEEKKSLNSGILGSGYGSEFWWNRSVGEMGLEEVVQFKERIEELRQNVMAAAEKEKKKTQLIDLPSPPVTTAESLYLSVLMSDDTFGIDQTWEWDTLNASISGDSSSMVPTSSDVGHY